MAKRVVILGGGVAGMSAAHELIERGFEVEVYEATKIPGGKARSVGVPMSGMGGKKDLPGEHGFRFFPGFYRHLPDTMKRIPVDTKTAYDNLVAAKETQLARIGKEETFLPAHFPKSLLELRKAFKFIIGFPTMFGIPRLEVFYFIRKLIRLMTTCKDRRIEEYEGQSWWQFIGAEHKSKNYQKYLADKLARSLVAMQPQVMSARTGGYVLLQFLFDFTTPGKSIDRVLNAPTNDAWLDPWLAYLQQRGVRYHMDTPLSQISCTGKRITGVTVVKDGMPTAVTADYYVAAIPIEVITPLITNEMKIADPRLALLQNLCTSWMTGVMFFLNRDVKIVHGHTNYFDSDWALTSISQKQFWPQVDLSTYGDGTVRGIISAIISDWDRPGPKYHKPARCCTIDEIVEEVWEQIKVHLNDGLTPKLDNSDLVLPFLAPSIVFPQPDRPENKEPLLINTVRSWHSRPDATTAIENFFLASDYVRTYTDLATMESANEAARRAVRGIMDAAGSTATPPEIWPLEEPAILVPFQEIDCLRYERKSDYRMSYDLYEVFPEFAELDRLGMKD